VEAALPTLTVSYDGCSPLVCRPLSIPSAAIDRAVGGFVLRLGAVSDLPSTACSNCTAYTIVVDYQLTVDDSSLPDSAAARLLCMLPLQVTGQVHHWQQRRQQPAPAALAAAAAACSC